MEKSKRCKDHPDFDPKNTDQFECDRRFSSCACCCGLHYAAKKVGTTSGEYATDECSKDRAILILTPTSFENFGHVRFSLGWNYHYYDEPSWYVDQETYMIYFTEDLPEHRLRGYLEEGWCTAQRRAWSEPLVGHLFVTMNGEKKAVGALSVSIVVGENNTELSMVVKKDVSLYEFLRAVYDFERAAHAVPNDSPVLTDVVLVDQAT